MKKASLLTAVVLAFGVAASLQGVARAAGTLAGVVVNVQPLPSKDNAYGMGVGVIHGYVEYRVRLKNTSNEDRVVYLSCPPTNDRAVSLGVVISKTVPVAAGQEVEVSFFQPPVYMEENRLEVRVRGERDSHKIKLPDSTIGYRTDESYPTVLIGRQVPQEFYDLVHSSTSSITTSYTYNHPIHALLRSELPVNRWSTNWLGYSCYDAILLTEKEAREMPPQVQLAVRRYLECGGTLWIHGREVPKAFTEGATPTGDNSYSVGLGRVAATLGENESSWKTTYAKYIKERPRIYSPSAIPHKNNTLLVAEATVPVRGLFVLVLLFGVGIGPVNLWLLSRYKRRIWLWWNVPVISLLTCLLVFGYSLFSEGIIGQGKTASMTILDERCHRATTFGYISYYCPLTPRGLHFDVDTEVTLMGQSVDPYQTHFRQSEQLRYVDWTEDQHLASGWVSARVPTYFQFRKNEDRRERLTVETTDDGSLKIVNALGADIERLYLSDASGKVFEGRDIAAGDSQTLIQRLVDPAKVNGPTDPQKIFHASNWLPTFKSMQANNPTAMLTPNSYVAYLDRSPFVESPLKSVDPEHTAAIVYGIMKGADDGR